MTPSRFDAGVVERRLRSMRETLADMSALTGVTEERLRTEPLTRAAAERFLQVLIDLAVDINSHLLVSISSAAPETARDSFLKLVAIGALTEQLAGDLSKSTGLRNILVHRYTDIDPAIVAASIAFAAEQFPEYIRQIATFVSDQTP